MEKESIAVWFNMNFSPRWSHLLSGRQFRLFHQIRSGGLQGNVNLMPHLIWLYISYPNMYFYCTYAQVHTCIGKTYAFEVSDVKWVHAHNLIMGRTCSYVNRREWKRLKGCVFLPSLVRPVPHSALIQHMILKWANASWYVHVMGIEMIARASRTQIHGQIWSSILKNLAGNSKFIY